MHRVELHVAAHREQIPQRVVHYVQELEINEDNITMRHGEAVGTIYYPRDCVLRIHVAPALSRKARLARKGAQ